MSKLLEQHPYSARDDQRFLEEMNALTLWHLRGCAVYERVWPHWNPASRIAELPFLHVSVFKHVMLKTQHSSLEFQRTLLSSSTTGGSPSRIALDARSSALQEQSSFAILKDAVGAERRPLLVLDDPALLRRRGEVGARVAAAMSLRPLATDMTFVLKEAADGRVSMNWAAVACMLRQHESVIIYGTTWILWTAWGNAVPPDDVREALAGKRISFVHSGGWKKLEAAKVDRTTFDQSLLNGLSSESSITDFYGLAEQVGVVYPLCSAGYRHVPRWSAVLVRDPRSLEPLIGEPGLLQLMNPLAFGAPYHSVLTEDLGRLVVGECPCGRHGTRFELLGRIPHSETRGCGNV